MLPASPVAPRRYGDRAESQRGLWRCRLISSRTTPSRPRSLAMALLGFGKLERLSDLLPEHADDVGFMLDRENLPQRVRRRNPEASSKNEGEPLYDRSPEGALF